MKFLIDASTNCVGDKANSPLVAGQLLTPLTRYIRWAKVYGVDNGALNRFNHRGFRSLLEREDANASDCLFVTCPDILGNGRRTLEIWRYRHRFARHWPMALVAQDGIEDLDIPWGEMSALFIGGCDPWKDSLTVVDLVKTAKILGLHVHVGRVNTAKRFKKFHEIGADTCDGSGVAKYDHMLADIERELSRDDMQPRLDMEGECYAA